jgi:hypothetical protein
VRAWEKSAEAVVVKIADESRKERRAEGTRYKAIRGTEIQTEEQLEKTGRCNYDSHPEKLQR